VPHTSRKFFQFIHIVKSYRRCWMLDLPSFWANIKTLLAGRSHNSVIITVLHCHTHVVTNKSVFSYRRTLTTWHCPHSHAAAADPRPCSSRSISPARSREPRRTDTVPLHKPCSTYYAGSANKMVWVESEYPRKFYKHLIMYFRFYG